MKRYRQNIGEKGENLAVLWLQKNGFIILYKNFRHGRLEIDILAIKNNILHIIEVKTRRTKKYGHPEESVHSKKIHNMKKVAELFQDEYSSFLFCIIAIYIPINTKEKIDIFFIEDIY